MNTIEWKSYLKQESKKAIAHYQQNKNAEIGIWQHTELSAETIKSQWIGFPGATEDQLIAAETRLGVTLPPSYQTFLKVTNGWSAPPGSLRLHSTEEINWFCTENQDWIDIWTDIHIPAVTDEQYLVYGNNCTFGEQPIRPEYMQTTLQISDEQDGDIILLNPEVIHQGEWEAWLWSDAGAGGIHRYRSFEEMIVERKILVPS